MSRSMNGKIKKDIAYLKRRSNRIRYRIQTFLKAIEVNNYQLLRLQAILKDRQDRQERYNETIKQG